ncbi:MAG TPA: hypothetical protein VMS31_23125 [Pyrinomonadaceae bacterium]|nr:hypothetical protein [Pyrinomonadaceae bacterium]
MSRGSGVKPPGTKAASSRRTPKKASSGDGGIDTGRWLVANWNHPLTQVVLTGH